MPEVTFKVRWPDASLSRCYSPSSTVREVFTIGRPYPLQEFVTMSRKALEHASERVAQKYGYGCGHAVQQIREIEQTAARFADQPQAIVIVEGYE